MNTFKEHISKLIDIDFSLFSYVILTVTNSIPSFQKGLHVIMYQSTNQRDQLIINKPPK